MLRKRKKSKAEDSGAAEETLPRQALMGHVKALRNMILISIAAIGIAFVVVFVGFSNQLITFMKLPINARGIELIYISLYESMMVQLKVSFIAGAVAASPVVFWQIWSFIRPALYPREWRMVIGMFLITVALFLAGAVFAYVIVFQMAINFFLLNSEGLAMPFISIERYVNFLVGFVLPFGLAFELPVAMVVLARSGLVPVSAFRKCRKYIIFAIFILAAFLTPPDVVSQVLLALPLVALFEAGILVSRLAVKRAERVSPDKT
jgi:sec-independent protein translocase protein TatC